MLGLEVDAPKLKWKSYVDKIQTLTQMWIDRMKKLTTLSWGGTREALLKFYTSYIKSKILYGIPI